jgi:GTP pyrophosphokinase
VIAVAWGARRADAPAVYPVDVLVEAADRQGLLRDISEVLRQGEDERHGVHTQSVKDSRGSTAWMTFTVEVGDTSRLAAVLAQVGQVRGCAARAGSEPRRC